MRVWCVTHFISCSMCANASLEKRPGPGSRSTVDCASRKWLYFSEGCALNLIFTCWVARFCCSTFPNVCVYTVYMCHTSRMVLKQTEWTKNNTDECRFVFSFPFESHYTWLIWRRFEARRSWFAAKETPSRERDGHSICMLHSWVGAHPKDPQEPHLYTLTGIKQDCKSVCCRCSDKGKPSDSVCLHQKNPKLLEATLFRKRAIFLNAKVLLEMFLLFLRYWRFVFRKKLNFQGIIQLEKPFASWKCCFFRNRLGSCIMRDPLRGRDTDCYLNTIPVAQTERLCG